MSGVTLTHRGVGFIVADRAPCPGIGWKIPAWKRTSQGAFYDGVPEHPEGATAWAEASCRAYIDAELAHAEDLRDIADAMRCERENDRPKRR
jgi:hypothetical protein